MNRREKELVVVSEETYNLCEGGKGGFGYINKTRDHVTHNTKISHKRTKETFAKISKALTGKPSKSKIKRQGKIWYDWTGKSHTELSRIKISIAKKGQGTSSNNSQFGTCWITNGLENKKIKKESLDEWMNKGYRQGRII